MQACAARVIVERLRELIEAFRVVANVPFAVTTALLLIPVSEFAIALVQRSPGQLVEDPGEGDPLLDRAADRPEIDHRHRHVGAEPVHELVDELGPLERRRVHMPKGLFCKTIEFADLAELRCSDAASYVTGAGWLVDGGIHAAYVTPLDEV